MLKTTPLMRGSFGGYLLPHKGFQDAGTFSRLVGTTPLLRGTLTPLPRSSWETVAQEEIMLLRV